MQAGIGGLASAVFCAVATAIGAAVLNVGLTRGLALVAMSAVGSAIGSFNPGVTGYFDDVSISHRFGGGFSANYDFQAAAAATVPEPVILAIAVAPA